MGVVAEVGSGVQKFKVGDKVGVGCMPVWLVHVILVIAVTTTLKITAPK